MSAVGQKQNERDLLELFPELFANRVRTSYDGAQQHVADSPPKASMSAIGQELKARDLLSPYDSSLDSSSWRNDLLAHIPRTSYDGAQQHVASLEPGEAFASQISPISPAFGQRRFSDTDSDTDSDTAPRSLLADGRRDVILRPRDHGSEVEVVIPSPNNRPRSSSIPPDFFDHIGDPLKSNSLDRLLDTRFRRVENFIFMFSSSFKCSRASHSAASKVLIVTSHRVDGLRSVVLWLTPEPKVFYGCRSSALMVCMA